MPRRAREKSKTGIYHIVLRGTNRRIIFHDDEDCRRFLLILEKFKKTSGCKVYAWCLMDNHVHLLAEEGEEDISATIKRINVSYVMYFNRKYEAVGHLFQGRYRSEKVEDNRYLLAVLRYIHRNPVKAGMAEAPQQWQWSSSRGYHGMKYFPSRLLDEEFVLGLLADTKAKARSELISLEQPGDREDFSEAKEEIGLEDMEKVRMTDRQASREIINRLMDEDICDITEIKGLPKKQRDELFRKIKTIRGISLRQAARILDVSHVLLFKA